MKKLLLLNSVALLSPFFLIISCKAKEQPPKEENPTPDPNPDQTPDPNPDEITKPKEDTKVFEQISIGKLKWENKSIEGFSTIEFKEKINQSIKKFILENKKIFFSGEISKIENEQDLGTITIENKNETSLFLNIVIESNRWYKNNEIQTSQLIQKVELTNFKTLPISLDDAGGKLSDSNLNATKYAKLLDLFKLNEKIPLNTLTNEFFNNKLKETEKFKNLNITIESGSTKSGSLSLSLSGTYGSSTITATGIQVTGFSIITSKSVGIQNLTLNKDAWFSDLKPIQETTDKENEIKSISSDDWQNKYVANFLIQDENYNTISNFEEMKKLGMNFSISGDIKRNTNFITLNITGTFKNKTYDKTSNKWNDDSEEIKLTPYAGRNGEAILFNKTEVEQYLLDKTKVNEEKLKNHYPSYFLGLLNYHKSTKTNFVISDLFVNEQFDKLNDKYLNWSKTGFTYAISDQYLEANDFKNTLSFGVNFVVDGTIKQDKIKNFSFSNKNKNINENQLIKNETKNRLIPTNIDFSSNTMLKIIKSKLKSTYKNEVDEVFKSEANKTTTIKNINKLIPDTITRQTHLYFDSDEGSTERADKNWTQMNKYFTPYLFDKQLKFSTDNNLNSNSKNEINAVSHLYTEDENSKFVINSIYYQFPENVDLVLTNMHANAISISLSLKTEVDFSGNEKRVYDTSFSFTMLKSQWEPTKKK